MEPKRMDDDSVQTRQLEKMPPMREFVSPFLRTPLTDLTANIANHQWYGRCADVELRAIECFEAYGLQRGFKQCDKLYQDFQECALRTKQFNRTLYMRDERHRQYKDGERSKKDLYAAPPAYDTFARV